MTALTPATRVRLVGTRKGIGTIRELVEPTPGWRRALVNWHSPRRDQFVDVAKLEAV